jgi:hypothetical protein
MHPLDVCKAGRSPQPFCGLQLRAGGRFMILGIVDDGAQPPAHLFKQRDDVGLVEVVGEEVERQRLIGRDLLQDIHDQVVSLEAQPFIHIARDLLELQSLIGVDWDDVLIA